jgi:5-formyltetrahydrofolate cyclo-ligase
MCKNSNSTSAISPSSECFSLPFHAEIGITNPVYHRKIFRTRLKYWIFSSNNTGKGLFVPFIDGPIMHMVKSPSLLDVQSFPSNSWGIPEPPSIEGRGNCHYSCVISAEWAALEGEGLDLIVVPGAGFDREMNRIGHGKGYYDHFIQRCHEHAKQVGRKPPTLSILPYVVMFGNITVALALEAQLIETGRIPMTETDWKMNAVVVNGEVLTQSGS